MARMYPDAPNMDDMPLMQRNSNPYHPLNNQNLKPTTVSALATSSNDVSVSGETVLGDGNRLKIKYEMKLENAEKCLDAANKQEHTWSELRKHLLWYVFAWLIVAVFSDTDQMTSWMGGHHLCDVIGHKEIIRIHDLMKWEYALGKFFIFKSHVFNETSAEETVIGKTRCVPEGGYAPVNATLLGTADYLTTRTRLFLWNHTPIVCLACMLGFVACFLALKSADATKRVFLAEKIESTLVLKAIREGETIKGKKSDYISRVVDEVLRNMD